MNDEENTCCKNGEKEEERKKSSLQSVTFSSQRIRTGMADYYKKEMEGSDMKVTHERRNMNTYKNRTEKKGKRENGKQEKEADTR